MSDDVVKNLCDLVEDLCEGRETYVHEYVDAALKAANYNEELEAKLEKAVGWHPIDTAPTDEAVLICGGDVLYPFVASLNNGEWDAEAQGVILREDIAEYPTHWMPLPAPPSQN